VFCSFLLLLLTVNLLQVSVFCLFADGTPVLTSFSLQRFLSLAVAGSSVFILSFGPFIVNVRHRIVCVLKSLHRLLILRSYCWAMCKLL